MASSPTAQAYEPDQSPQMVRLANFVLPSTSARIKAHTLRYCPPMDLVAAALEDESWNVWRLGGSRVFGGSGFTAKSSSRNTASGRVSISAMEWKASGMLLAIACTDNSIRLVSAHSGKVVHLLSTRLSTISGSLSHLGWSLSHTDPSSQPSQANGEGTAYTDSLLTPKLAPGVSAIKPDLPRDLALIDVEASFPKLSTLPATGLDDDVFSAKASLDAMFHGSEVTSPTDVVDILVSGFDDGSIHLKIFDSFEIGTVDLGSVFKAGKCKILQHASHDKSSVHSFIVMEPSQGLATDRFVVNVSLRFITASPRYLSVVVAKSTQLQNLLRYITQVQDQISQEWKTAQDLPSKFLRNINESLREKSDCDFITAAYHLVVTGDCYPPLKEFLVDELGERGHKRWEKAMINGYETIRRLVHECFLPSIERCQIVISRLKGIASFRKAGGVLGLDVDSLNAVDDTLDCLNMLGHRLVGVISQELRLFAAFSKWLRLEIDIQATDPDVSNVDDLLERQDAIEHKPVLDYISGAISDSQMLLYIRPSTSKEEESSTWAPPDPRGGYYKQYKCQSRPGQGHEREGKAELPKLVDFASYLKHQCEQIFSQIGSSLRKSILVSSPVSLPAEFDQDTMDVWMQQVDPEPGRSQSFRMLMAARQKGENIAFYELPIHTHSKLREDARVVAIDSEETDSILDIKFVDDETIMVLRENGKEARIESWNYSNLDEITREVKHVFDLSSSKSNPSRLEVNGRKTRRAVCVLFEDRQSYSVFDIDNAVETEEGPQAEAVEDMEMQQD